MVYHGTQPRAAESSPVRRVSDTTEGRVSENSIASATQSAAEPTRVGPDSAPARGGSNQGAGEREAVGRSGETIGAVGRATDIVRDS